MVLHTSVNIESKPQMLVVSLLMLLDCTICMEMSGSGVKIVGMRTIKERQLIIVLG